MHNLRIGLLLVAALVLLAPAANADPTTGMVYMVIAEGGAFDSYSAGGPPQAITILTIAEILGGPINDLQINQFNNMVFTAPPGSEYFIFGSVPQDGPVEFGLASPLGVAPQPLPNPWEMGIVPGLENMQNLNPALMFGGTVVGSTTTELWNHLAASQMLGFNDEAFAEITNFRTSGGDTNFMSYDPLGTIVFGTNEDPFTAFTPPTGAGQFTNNYFQVPFIEADGYHQIPLVVINPVNFPGLPDAPGTYLTQLELPEPGTLVLLAGALGFGILRRRRKSAA